MGIQPVGGEVKDGVAPSGAHVRDGGECNQKRSHDVLEAAEGRLRWPDNHVQFGFDMGEVSCFCEWWWVVFFIDM